MWTQNAIMWHCCIVSLVCASLQMVIHFLTLWSCIVSGHHILVNKCYGKVLIDM